MLASEFSNEAHFADVYREVFGDATVEEIEAQRQAILDGLDSGGIGLADPETDALHLGISDAFRLARLIFVMSWTFLEAPGRFLTSDRGLAMVDPKPQHPWSGQSWLSSPYVEVTIPVCSVCRTLPNEPRGAAT